jgi:hypothetical protein
MLDKFTMVFTNVPGPTNRQYLAGYPITGIQGSVNSPLGSTVMLNSYQENMYFSMCADIATGIDAREFVKIFEAETMAFHAECREKMDKKVNLRGVYAFMVLLFLLVLIVYVVLYTENVWMYHNVASLA